MPNTSESPPPEGGGDNTQPRWNTCEVIEGRTPYRMWVPRYVYGLFAERIGSTAVSIYGSLAWWLTSDAPHHRPTLAEIGARAGCSRATVWRTLPALVEARLIEVEPVVGPQGRRAHRIKLVHPPEVSGQSDSSGTEPAGDSNLSAPRSQNERAERSNCALGALKTSAPSLLQNGSKSVCVNEPTHTPDPPPPPTTHQAATERLCAFWISRLPPGAPDWRHAQEDEIPWAVTLLLSRGWTEDQLQATMNDPTRRPNEWPREWALRLGPKPPKVGPTPAEREIERQRAAETRRREHEAIQRERAEWAASGIPSFMEFVRRKLSAAAGQAPPLPTTGATLKDPRPPAPAGGVSAPVE